MHLVGCSAARTSAPARGSSISRRRKDARRHFSLSRIGVRDLMAVGSVLVTKPGGMSCTEALATRLPQVLYHPHPGQEEDNAAAMVRYGAGVMVPQDRGPCRADAEDPDRCGPPAPYDRVGGSRPSPPLGTLGASLILAGLP
jgi:hypothetical protein